MTEGPYRFYSHPNYAIVLAEIAVLPLAFGAWEIAALFSILNLALLAWRIHVETTALAPRGRVSVFACAELDPPIITFFDNTMRPLEHMREPGEQYDVKLAERGRSDFIIRAGILSRAVSDRDYLLGSDFSGADILIGHSCFMATFIGLPIGDFPILEAYFGRLQQRPGYQRAYGS